MTGQFMEINRTDAARRAKVSTLLALALASSAALSVLPATATPTGRPVLRSVIVTGVGDVASAVRHAGGVVLDQLPLIAGVSARH